MMGVREREAASGGMASDEGDRRPLLLIAEDEPDNQVILQTVAESLLDAQVLLASDGFEVLSLAGTTSPDLVLLDLMMPVLDGFQVARKLRDDPATAGIPIVAISALARPGDRDAAIEAGCDDFVRKPFELDELESTLRSQLARSPRWNGRS